MKLPSTIAVAGRALAAELQERRRRLVPGAGGRRAAGGHHGARPRRRRPGVIGDLARDVDRQRLALLDQGKQARMGRVARRIDDARDADAIARLQRLHVRVGERRPHVFDFLGGGLRPSSETSPLRWHRRSRRSIAIAHSVTSLWRWAWHSISSEGGCAPLPNLPPSMAPATPALERRGRSRGAAILTASLPCS